MSLFSNLRELWNYRQLIRSFAVRDYKVRFAQTFLGYWWAVLQPLASIATLYIVFQKIVDVPTQGIPYLPFALSGLILWNYFNYVVTQSASSLINAQSMIKKVYFPRLSLPISKALVGLIEPLIGGVIFFVILWIENIHLTWGMAWLPLFLFLTVIAATGLGLWVSSLSIRLRDLQQILPFALQIVFFITPVAYAGSLLDSIIPDSYNWILYLNPMYGIIESFRWALFGQPWDIRCLISVGVAIFLFISGLFYFQRTERTIADVV